MTRAIKPAPNKRYSNIMSLQEVITKHINSYRTKHHAKSIAHSNPVSVFSQSYAQKLCETGKFEHSGNKSYGENLACFFGHKDDKTALVKKAIDSWYSEVSKYDFDKATLHAAVLGQ